MTVPVADAGTAADRRPATNSHANGYQPAKAAGTVSAGSTS